MVSGTVAERITRELLTSMKSEPKRHVLVWLDPDEAFSRLVPSVAETLRPNAELIRFGRDDSQVALKMDLLGREGRGELTVVYAPTRSLVELVADPEGGTRPPLWALAEYRYRGAIWAGGAEGEQATALIQWLQRQGVEPLFGGDETEIVEGGSDSILARYVEMLANTDPSGWARPLRADDVRHRLAGDPTEAALLLLRSPRTCEAEWGDRTPEVLRSVANRFGIPQSESTADCAEALALLLALVDAWDAFGRRDDFPYAAVLPTSIDQRENSLKLLRNHVLRRQDLAPRFHDVVARAHSRWGAIAPWAASLPGQPLGIKGLVDQRITALLAGLDLSTPETRAESASRLRDAVASWPLNREEWVESMKAVALSIQITDAISAATAEYDALHDAALLIDAFGSADGWNRIDMDYLHLASMTGTEPSLSPLRGLVDRTYVAWVANVNDRFDNLIESADAWPPEHVNLAPPPEWTANSRQRRGVIVTDALRIDVAWAVQSRLRDAELELGLSTLPSTTPFGMTALLPHRGTVQATIESGEVVLREEGSKFKLNSRDGRMAWLSDALAGRGQSVATVELKAVLEGRKPPQANLTVVFDYRLDDAGHGQGSVPDEVDEHVARLSRCVEVLHDNGIGTVDVVTDHGFLHMPPHRVEALGKPPVSPAQAFKKFERYALLKPDAPVESLIRLSSPLAPALNLGFARGVRSLEKPSEYMHGGISLQECVIGRIRSTRSLGANTLGVHVSAQSSELTTGTLAVRVVPEASGQMTLSPPQPRRIRLSLSTEAGAEVSDAVEAEVRSDAPPQLLALYLREGTALAAGTKLRLVALDAETGETMHTADLALLVDWS
jgi:hypothetical protein